jgi:ribose transport system ATP-binding protein
LRAALEVRHITKSFGGQAVLCDVGFDVPPGRVFGLVGENGSGKSTLIKVLSGYHLPEPGGTVIVAGRHMALGSPSASRAAGLRFMHQNQGLVLSMNAVENMGLGSGYGSRWWVRWKTQADATRRALSALDIDMDVEMPLSRARAVERAAVAVARAIKVEPGNQIHMLVLDEPTATLPPGEVDVLFNIIRRSCERGLSVLYVSHRLDEVEEITDEVAVLRDGALQGVRDLKQIGRQGLIAMILGGDEEPVMGRLHPLGMATDGEMAALEVRGLRSERLMGIDFSVRHGEIVGFAGIEGSGREELARALVGGRPSLGSVSVKGTLISRLTPRRAVGAGLALLPGITEAGSSVAEFDVRENLTLATLSGGSGLSGPIGLRRRAEKEFARHWINEVDVRPRDPAAPLPVLSGGNKQKVVFAKWLALKSPVYALDEPTAGVDVGARRTLHTLVASEAAKGTAFVVCSSDLEDLEAMCHRIVILQHGSIVAELVGEEITRARLLELMSGDPSSESNGTTELT